MAGNGGGSAYEVVWPLGKAELRATGFAGRVADLNGKTVAEVNDFEWGESWSLIREDLKRRYPDIKIVEYSAFGATHGSHEREVISSLPERLRQHGCDAVISGNGI